jgi:phosphate transport system substrate-binding protein
LEPTDIPTAFPSRNAVSPTVDIGRLNARNYPRVDGSTSALPLQVTLACKILNVACAWQEDIFFGSTRRVAPLNEFDALRREAELLTSLYHNGTHGAYMNLINREVDFILVARSPSEDELGVADRKGVQFLVQPVALDAFVFLANAENPVSELSLDEIRSIYTGEIPNWSDVGGVEGKIHTYQRNRNSGSQELMDNLVMRGTAMRESPDMILDSMMGPFNAISGDPLGIGYSVYFYTEFIHPNEMVKMIGVDGIHPTSKSIADRSYPLVTEVYAVARGDTSSESPAGLLLAWLLTEEGQSTIAESGYVPLFP